MKISIVLFICKSKKEIKIMGICLLFLLGLHHCAFSRRERNQYHVAHFVGVFPKGAQRCYLLGSLNIKLDNKSNECFSVNSCNSPIS